MKGDGDLRAGIRNAEWAEVLARYKLPAGLVVSAMRTALLAVQRSIVPAAESMLAAIGNLPPGTLAALQGEPVERKAAPIARQMRWLPLAIPAPKAKESRSAGHKWPA